MLCLSPCSLRKTFSVMSKVSFSIYRHVVLVTERSLNLWCHLITKKTRLTTSHFFRFANSNALSAVRSLRLTSWRPNVNLRSFALHLLDSVKQISQGTRFDGRHCPTFAAPTMFCGTHHVHVRQGVPDVDMMSSTNHFLATLMCSPSGLKTGCQNATNEHLPKASSKHACERRSNWRK